MNRERSPRTSRFAIGFRLAAFGVFLAGGLWAFPPPVGAAEPGCSPGSTPSSPGVEVGYGVGQRAPDFALPDFSGVPVSLSAFRGCPVVLDFWASWCKPCQVSVPKLEALRQKYQAFGLKVVAVSLDYRREDAARFLEAHGIRGFINLWAPFSESRAVAHLFGIESIPRTVFLDRQGIIRFIGHPESLTDAVLAPWL